MEERSLSRTALLVAAVLLLPVVPLRAGGALDGRTFVGESGEKGKTTGQAEEIDFKAGKVHSKGCDPYGFGSAPYTATVKDRAIHWQAVTTSEKEGTISWKGTVKADALEGAFTWSKPGQAPIDYWVKGTLKK